MDGQMIGECANGWMDQSVKSVNGSRIDASIKE